MGGIAVMTDKQRASEALQTLPADASVEDVIENVRSVERYIADDSPRYARLVYAKG